MEEIEIGRYSEIARDANIAILREKYEEGECEEERRKYIYICREKERKKVRGILIYIERERKKHNICYMSHKNLLLTISVCKCTTSKMIKQINKY